MLVLAGVISCGPTPKLPPVDAPPRLVVLLIIDQWPQWSFVAKRAAFTGASIGCCARASGTPASTHHLRR